MDTPIVSVIVSTYNSAEFIIETLESIKNQTFSEFELIITDDCSTDNTIDICKDWVKENQKHFNRVVFLQSQVNTGVVKNANRGLAVADGEWIKFIAGDDIMKPNYLEVIMMSALTSSHELICSKITPFLNYDETYNIKIDKIINYWESNYSLFQGNQLKNYLNRYFIPSPGVIIKKEILSKTNGFDERFEVEDVPYWLKILSDGYRFELINDYLIDYRIHNKSLSNRSIAEPKSIIDMKSYKFSKSIFLLITRNIFLKYWMLSELYKGYVKILRAEALIFLGNYPNLINKAVYKIITIIFLPNELFRKNQKNKS